MTDVIFSVLAGVWKNMFLADILITWAFAIGGFLFVDCAKMLFFVKLLGEDSGETISFEEFSEGAPQHPESGAKQDADPEAAGAEVERVRAKEARLSNHGRHTLEGSDREGHKEVSKVRGREAGVCVCVCLCVWGGGHVHRFLWCPKLTHLQLPTPLPPLPNSVEWVPGKDWAQREDREVP